MSIWDLIQTKLWKQLAAHEAMFNIATNAIRKWNWQYTPKWKALFQCYATDVRVLCQCEPFFVFSVMMLFTSSYQGTPPQQLIHTTYLTCFRTGYVKDKIHTCMKRMLTDQSVPREMSLSFSVACTRCSPAHRGAPSC